MTDASGTTIDWLGKADGVHWLIGQLLENWSEALDDTERARSIPQLLAQAAGTIGAPASGASLHGMALAHLLRHHMPAWLRLAGLADYAEAMAAAERHGGAISADLDRLIGLVADGVDIACQIEALRPELAPFDHYASLHFVDAASDLWAIARNAADRAVRVSGVEALIIAAGSTTPAGTSFDPFLKLEEICITAATVAAGRAAWRAFVREPFSEVDTRERHAVEALGPTTNTLRATMPPLIEAIIARARQGG